MSWHKSLLLVTTALLLGGNSALGEDSSSSARAKSAYEQGNAALDKEEFQKAIELFSSAISLDPTLSNVYVYRGFAYGRIGQSLKEIDDDTAAIRLNPKDHVPYYNRGLAYESLSRYQEAIADFSAALQLEPNNGDTLVQRGLCFFEKHESAKPLADLNSAVTKNPKNFQCLEARAGIRIEQGDYDGGIADLKAAIALDPNDAATHFENWSKHKLTDEQLRHGEEQVRRMLHDRPNMKGTGQDISVLCRWAARKFAGEDVGEKVLWDPTEPLHEQAESSSPREGLSGFIRVRQTEIDGRNAGKDCEFEDLWQSLVDELYNITNDELPGLFEAAGADGQTKHDFMERVVISEAKAEEKGRAFYVYLFLPWAKAEHFNSNAFTWHIGYRSEYSPESILSSVDRQSFYWHEYERRYDASELSRRIGKSKDDAIGFAKHLVSEAKTNEDKVEVLIRCASQFEQSDYFDNAIGYFEEAIHLAPGESRALIGLARCEKSRRQFNEAPAYKQGIAALGKEEYRKAIELLSRAISLDPTLPNIYGYRGYAYDRIGQSVKAIDDYSTAIRLSAYPITERMAICLRIGM